MKNLVSSEHKNSITRVNVTNYHMNELLLKDAGAKCMKNNGDKLLRNTYQINIKITAFKVHFSDPSLTLLILTSFCVSYSQRFSNMQGMAVI